MSTILIIDDDEDDRMFLEEAIAEVDSSRTCRSAENAIDALEFLKSNKNSLPGLIILDLNLPSMDGKSFLKELLQHPWLKKIPVVIYSTSRNEQDVRETQILGASRYIIKPSSFKKLVEEVRQILDSNLMAAKTT